ncbi:hypothetical protein VNO77_14400 [Canavalia gladiata]|uniref:Uncharacterized protein n=1 Tax=Canavalia gladiata TaxID=3824 RepID=A0AAN9LYN9_CANGL
MMGYLQESCAMLGKPRRRWRLAYTTIKCARILMRVLTKVVTKNNTINVPYKRWRVAFAAIYSFRAITSLPRKVVAQNNHPFLHSPSFVTIHVEPDPFFPNVNISSITKIVKGKDHDSLRQFGGIDGLVMLLKSDERQGIDGNHEDITCRQKAFGCNRYHKLTTKSFFHFVGIAMKDPILIILLLCGTLSLGFNIIGEGLKHGWYDGGSILIAILVVVTVCSMSHFWPYRKFNKLSQMRKEEHVEVVRNGQQQQVLVSNIVVGDVVCLRRGNQVPADGLVVSAHSSLQMDESNLGEDNQHVQVNQALNPFLFAGTKVESGHGQMLVTSVGENTRWGEIMSLLGGESYKWRSLENKLIKLTNVMSLIGFMVAVLTSINLLARFFSGHIKNRDGSIKFKLGQTKVEEVWKAVVGILVTTVAVASSAIPEGLPLAVAIEVAYTMKGMIKNRALFRQFSTCVQLASTSIICIDIADIVTDRDKMKLEFWLKDSIQPGVTKAVQDCKQAGVNIKLITSEDALTATAIASECGILPRDEEFNNEQVMEALELRNYTATERIQKIDKICVMAKATSSDKLLLVQCLKQNGHVVAVTGNSIGDAPALKEADVSIYMGLQGNSIATESSDIVVLNEGFVSVFAVLKVWRAVYDNIKVFIQYLLAANLASLVTDFISTISADQLPTIDILSGVSVTQVPYAVLQILWLKLIIGTLAALALVVEQNTEFMQEPPTRPDEPLISNKICKNILIRASYEIAILLTFQFKGEQILGLNGDVKDALVFNLMVLFQVFAVLKARKPEGNIFKLQKRKLFWGIIFSIVILQVVMLKILAKVAGAGDLNWWQWCASICIAFTSWPIEYVGNRCIPVPKKSFMF